MTFNEIILHYQNAASFYEGFKASEFAKEQRNQAYLLYPNYKTNMADRELVTDYLISALYEWLYESMEDIESADQEAEEWFSEIEEELEQLIIADLT